MSEIIVPAEIFDLAPEIQDMKSFKYPGAEFSTAQYINKFSIFITFELDKSIFSILSLVISTLLIFRH